MECIHDRGNGVRNIRNALGAGSGGKTPGLCAFLCSGCSFSGLDSRSGGPHRDPRTRDPFGLDSEGFGLYLSNLGFFPDGLFFDSFARLSRTLGFQNLGVVPAVLDGLRRVHRFAFWSVSGLESRSPTKARSQGLALSVQSQGLALSAKVG